MHVFLDQIALEHALSRYMDDSILDRKGKFSYFTTVRGFNLGYTRADTVLQLFFSAFNVILFILFFFFSVCQYFVAAVLKNFLAYLQAFAGNNEVQLSYIVSCL